MVVLTKSLKHPFHFRSVTVNLAKPPGNHERFEFSYANYYSSYFSKEMFHRRGLRRLPSLEDGDQVIDNVEDIVSYLEV